MKIRTKLFAALALAAACHGPAFALVSFADLSDQWSDKKVPSTHAVLHYIHGSVETIIVQEALSRKMTGKGWLCKLFKEDGDLVEPPPMVVRRVVDRFRDIAAKDPEGSKKYTGPQMVLMQMEILYGCGKK